jgi:hypothetical protein
VSTPNIYDLGDLVNLTGRFYSDPALTTLADPTSVVLSIRDPRNAVTLPTVVHASTGIYTYAWTPTIPGLYEVNWTATGVVVSADQEAVYVKVGIQLGTDLCSLDEVKEVVGLTNSNRDGQIGLAITAASAAITNRYQREFAPMGALTRTFQVDRPRIDLAPYDLASITTVTIYPDDASQAITRYSDFDLRPVGGSILGTYTSILLSRLFPLTGNSIYRYRSANIAIAGTWGAQTIHPDVRRAAAITAGSWIDRGANDYGMPDIGDNGMAVRPDRPSTWAIPAAAHRLLQPFERWSYT